MLLSFKKKKIVIFGGSNGVGLSLAKKLLNDGAKVLIICKTKKNLLNAKKHLKNTDYKILISDCYKFNNLPVHKICKSFFDSKIDHLVSFLGTGKVNFGIPLKIKIWKDVFDKNFFVNVNIVNEFLKYFNKKNFTSSIVLTGAIAGIERLRAPMTYSIAKTTLIAYTNHLAENLLERKIRVFCVSPGNIYFKNGRWEKILKKDKNIFNNYIKKNVGFRRFADPNEIANVYYNLMHESNSFMSGNNIVVDGLQTKKIL